MAGYSTASDMFTKSTDIACHPANIKIVSGTTQSSYRPEPILTRKGVSEAYRQSHFT